MDANHKSMAFYAMNLIPALCVVVAAAGVDPGFAPNPKPELPNVLLNPERDDPPVEAAPNNDAEGVWNPPDAAGGAEGCAVPLPNGEGDEPNMEGAVGAAPAAAEDCENAKGEGEEEIAGWGVGVPKRGEDDVVPNGEEFAVPKADCEGALPKAGAAPKALPVVAPPKPPKAGGVEPKRPPAGAVAPGVVAVGVDPKVEPVDVPNENERDAPWDCGGVNPAIVTGCGTRYCCEWVCGLKDWGPRIESTFLT